MIVKIVTAFLIVIAVMAMFGRLRFPGQDHLARLRAPKCRSCGRPKIGKGPCPCGARE